jgi:ectoine hydroxylase-related dioxygenase (phytanoyl-CoA dioxygenase family)
VTVAPTDVVDPFGTPITNTQRATFERDGYLVLSDVLPGADVAMYAEAIDDVYRARARAGQLDDHGAMHLLDAVAHCPELLPLVDHPRVLGLAWSLLGWNIHVYHSHVDVHPGVDVAGVPYRFHWHQDGGRQNREVETDPRPRLSVKVAYWLSDLSRPGRGNLKVVPGSHLMNRIDGPPSRDVPWPEPAGAVEITAGPGDALLFDRRLWHARTPNTSRLTRRAAFFAYTYRWVHSRDDRSHGQVNPAPPDLTPVRRQLLGRLPDAEGDHAWGHAPHDVPLYSLLRATGHLTPDNPPLRP